MEMRRASDRPDGAIFAYSRYLSYLALLQPWDLGISGGKL